MHELINGQQHRCARFQIAAIAVISLLALLV
jgi:hypothetical protein